MIRINLHRNASQIIVKLITANFNQLQKFNLVVGGDLCTGEYFGSVKMKEKLVYMECRMDFQKCFGIEIRAPSETARFYTSRRAVKGPASR